MKKFIYLCLIIMPSLFAACAINAVDPNIPSNVTLSDVESYNKQYIDSVHFKLEKEHLQGNPEKCLALTVDNKAYTLDDSSDSFVGAFTGNIYNIKKQREVGGGKTLVYSDADTAIAKGSVDGNYPFGLISMTKIVTFKVQVDIAPEKRSITFTDIRSALQSTGYADNDGFTRAGAWSGAKPVFVHDLLNNTANKIKRCLASN